MSSLVVIVAEEDSPEDPSFALTEVSLVHGGEVLILKLKAFLQSCLLPVLPVSPDGCRIVDGSRKCTSLRHGQA